MSESLTPTSARGPMFRLGRSRFKTFTLTVLVTSASAALMASLGLAHLPLWVVASGTALIATTTTLGALAFSEPRHRVGHLVGVIACLLASHALIYCYNTSRESPRAPVTMVIRGNDVQTVGAVGEPEGVTPVRYYVSGSSVSVDCRVTIGDTAGDPWYRLAGGSEWLPGSVLRYPLGITRRAVPACP